MASTPENSELSSGLAALKQKDYQSAIAHLEQVCQLELDLSRVERAQIGLVTAYAQVGDREKAIAIAQTLIHSRNPRSATWE
ncbi:MAG: tetratricopeptide repeat protein, partial [Desertifilum sp. SIO1I2]|nr:tetratricopeptide repeat protein [Desertifilum sp. SIO1I2]